jgi:copper chaperone CopZ
MKKIIMFSGLLLMVFFAQAQFTKAMLQASGLTCSMCNNAINKALKALPFVSAVKPDIKNAAFDITFKDGATADIDALKAAVEDAGFSVAKLKMTGNFNRVSIHNDEHVVINGRTFHFLSVTDQALNGEKTLMIVDKDFLTVKEFRRFSKSTQMSCVQTGKAAGCCKKEGIAENTRIYHVTI